MTWNKAFLIPHLSVHFTCNWSDKGPVSPAHFSQSQQKLHSVCTEKPTPCCRFIWSHCSTEVTLSSTVCSIFLKLPHTSRSPALRWQLCCVWWHNSSQSWRWEEGLSERLSARLKCFRFVFQKRIKKMQKNYTLSKYVKVEKILNVFVFWFFMCNILRQRLAVSICSAWQYWWQIQYTVCWGPREWSSY